MPFDPKKLLGAISHKVASQRRSLKWSQQELAERARLSVKGVSEAERGATNPSILVLRSLATGLGVDLPRLIAEPGQATREIEALLSGRTRAEQAKALALLTTFLAPPEKLE